MKAKKRFNKLIDLAVRMRPPKSDAPTDLFRAELYHWLAENNFAQVTTKSISYDDTTQLFWVDVVGSAAFMWPPLEMIGEPDAPYEQRIAAKLSISKSIDYRKNLKPQLEALLEAQKTLDHFAQTQHDADVERCRKEDAASL